MMACRSQQWLRAALATFVVLGSLGLAVTALSPIRAKADELSGSAIVEYSPRSWPFAVSATGSGRLELLGDSASPMIIVRDGAAEVEVAQGQVIAVRLVPDEGASVRSVLVDGEDASNALGGDGMLLLAAQDAQTEMRVVFSDAAPGAASVNDGRVGTSGDLLKTGDIWRIGAIAIALFALSAFYVARYAVGRRNRDDEVEVSTHKSA